MIQLFSIQVIQIMKGYFLFFHSIEPFTVRQFLVGLPVYVLNYQKQCQKQQSSLRTVEPDDLKSSN